MNAFAKRSLVLQTFQNLCVGFVHYGIVQWGQINLCGRLGIMSHSFTDNRNRNVLAFGCACPWMTGTVHAKRNGYIGQSGYFFQVPIYSGHDIPVMKIHLFISCDLLIAIFTLYCSYFLSTKRNDSLFIWINGILNHFFLSKNHH